MADRLFLDANVLFSAAYREGVRVRTLWSLDDVVLTTSSYAVEEARRNLASSERPARLEELLSDVIQVGASTVPSEERGEIELPEKDWPIVAGALAADASHLITGDVRDFGAHFGERILGIAVLLPADYLRTRS